MATPHHHTFPTEEQRRRRPQRALRHRIQLQRPPAPDSSTNLHAAACAVLCGGTPRVCPQPLWSWRAIESGQHGGTAHSTACSSAMAACSPERAFLTACPPALLHGAPCGAHILQRHIPHGCRCIMPLRTHAPPSARAHGGGAGVLTCKLVACSFCCAALCGAHAAPPRSHG